MKNNKSLKYPMNLINDIMGFDEDVEFVNYDKVMLLGVINKILSTLSDKHRSIISMRYEHSITYREIGYVYGKTQGRIRQIVQYILRKLRNPDIKRLIRIVLNLNEYSEDINKAVKIYINSTNNDPLLEFIKMIEGDEDVLKWPITELGFSIRIYTSLYRINKDHCSLEEAIGIINSHINGDIHLRNIGEKSIQEFIDRVNDLGYGYLIEQQNAETIKRR